MTTPPFANPMPPSIAEVEALRQAEVRATRDVYMLANGGALAAATPTQPSHGWGWWLMAALLFALTFASGMAVEKRLTERRYAAVPNPEGLEQRVTDVETDAYVTRKAVAGIGREVDRVQEIIGETKEGQP